jgi:type II secretory pathway pseudopilin PulG
VTAGLGSGRGAFARRSRDENARDEEGFTLVEILITVWIMGGVMVALIGALFTMSRASDMARRNTVAETELRHLAEAVRSAPYEDCINATTRIHYTTGYSNPNPATILAGINGQTLWNPPSSATADPQQFVADVAALHSAHPIYCDGSPTQTDAGAQKLNLWVWVFEPGGNKLIATTIVKRDNRVETAP